MGRGLEGREAAQMNGADAPAAVGLSASTNIVSPPHSYAAPAGPFLALQASKLRVKSASMVSRVEILPPGTFGTAPRLLPSGGGGGNGSTKSFPATSSTVSSRRALPSSTSGSQ